MMIEGRSTENSALWCSLSKQNIRHQTWGAAVSNSSDSYSETTIRSDSLSTDVFVFLVERGRKGEKKKSQWLPKMSTDRLFQSSLSPPPPPFRLWRVIKFPVVLIFIRARNDLLRENTKGVFNRPQKWKQWTHWMITNTKNHNLFLQNFKFPKSTSSLGTLELWDTGSIVGCFVK